MPSDQQPVFKVSRYGTEVQRVRVYNDGLLLQTSDSDSSTLESQSDMSSLEDELPEPYNLTVEELLEERRAQFDATLVALNAEIHEMEAAGNNSAQLNLISKPMASKLAHTLLHPSLYRLVKGVGQSIDGLVQMATQLKAASNWQSAAEQCINSLAVMTSFRGLTQTDQPEVQVDRYLTILVSYISQILQVECFPVNLTAQVGGVMCRADYDCKSKMDLAFAPTFNSMDVTFATELKTSTAFAADSMWYRKCRLAQVLAALYSTGAPTILLSPVQFKIFFENESRTEIWTFPSDQSQGEHGLTQTSPMSRDLIRALVILLLRDNGSFVTPVRDGDISTTFNTPQQKARTSQKSSRSTKKADEYQEGVTTRSKAKRQKMDVESRPLPRFISGNLQDGTPIYQDIRFQLYEDKEVPQDSMSCDSDENTCGITGEFESSIAGSNEMSGISLPNPCSD
ncbi:hypothetical protein MP228_009915 [Amoeboaphelidium protococcarum]|nr:hypothetical protein MP228_009915 [Amoeboaphelidium protococcarum]